MKKFLLSGLMFLFLISFQQLFAMTDLSKFYDKQDVGWGYNVGWLMVPEYNDAVLIHVFSPDNSPQINASGDCNFEYVGFRMPMSLLKFDMAEFKPITISPKGDLNASIPANTLYYWKSFWQNDKKSSETGAEIKFTFSDKPETKGGVVIQSEKSDQCTSQEELEKVGLIWSAKQIHPSPSLWGLKPATILQSELEKKLTQLKNSLAMLKAILASLSNKLVLLKDALSGTKVAPSPLTPGLPPVKSPVVEPKLILPLVSDVTFDSAKKKHAVDVKDDSGALIARLELAENKDQGRFTVTPDVFNKIKGTWYDSDTYKLKKVFWGGKEGWNIINPKRGNFAFYKITQKDLDDLDSTNPNKNRTEFIGEYLPGTAFMDIGQGAFNWDSKNGPGADHQPSPPWIEIAVRTFADVLWPTANTSKPTTTIPPTATPAAVCIIPPLVTPKSEPLIPSVMSEVYITLVHGDITKQKFQNDAQAAIVNAANSVMRGGGGIDGAIHSAAGPFLWAEEEAGKLTCPTGQARLTMGYNLVPLRIIHTVGPRGENPDKEILLRSAYTNCLKLADNPVLSSNLVAGQIITTNPFNKPVQNKIITQSDLDKAKLPITAIAFNCISTAIFGYDINQATPVALKAVLDYLKNTPGSKIQEIRFVVFSVNDYKVYINQLAKLASDFVPDALTTPDLKLKESSVGGGGITQPALRFKFVAKKP